MTSETRPTSAYLRYPDVRGDLITFVAANDVWCAPLSGGHAWRITDDAAPVSFPRLSPDGTQVAFVAQTSGGPEVYVAASNGTSAVRRLTYWGNRLTRVAGWLDGSHLIVTSGHGTPTTLRDAQLYSLSLDGEYTLLPFGRGSEVAIRGDGTTIVTTMWRREPAQWKHYQGGTAAKLWVSHEDVALDAPAEVHAKRVWAPLLDEVLASKTRGFFYGDRFVFASDTPGVGAALTDRASGNLWSVNVDGSDLRQHTHFTSEQGYLREPASDGKTIVFSSRGRLYSMTSPDAEPQPIDVLTAGVFGALRDFPAPTDQNLLSMRPVDERMSVVEWRGSAHALTHRRGPSRLLAGASGLRIREVHPLPESPFALYVTDELAQNDRTDGGVGSDALGFSRLDGTGTPSVLSVGEIGRILHVSPAPDGSKIAVTTSGNTIHVVTLDTSHETPRISSTEQLAASTGGEIRDMCWSPDSRYLLWCEPDSWFRSRMMLRDPDGQTHVITDGRYQDSSPCFSADGRYLAFISARTFETMYDELVFDLSFVNAQRPYLIPLERTTPDPFGPDVDGWGAARSDSEQDLGDKTSADEADPKAEAATKNALRFDVDAIEARIVHFPVESGQYTDLKAIKGGFAWLRHPGEGVLGNARAGVEGEGPKPDLQMWSFQDHKLTTLVEGVAAFEVTPDGEHLLAHTAGKHAEWILIPATHSVDEDDDARITIDTSRLRLTIDPVAERRGMLWDNYRLMAQQYWRADMDGQDWHSMVSWYDETVANVVSDDDFVDMMWEVVGELGTSHAYVFGPAWEPEASTKPGFLGADVEARDGAFVITNILPGDSSDPGARSPLQAPGVNANVGDRIVAIDGRRIEGKSIGEYLAGTAGKPTELLLERDSVTRRVVVVPLADDAQLRYQAWVASRRTFVKERSGGRLGYLHIPDMVSTGWAQMHRDLRSATEHEGIVVDVRYNGGGHTSQLVTDRLARKVVSWGYARNEKPGTYPEFAPRGAVVLVTNQEAGSDGDIVNAVSQAMKIGPVIGTRTWGGVIGIDGRFDLVDGTGVTQPKYASWFKGVDWSIENYGVDPDIEVPFPPNEWFAGEDPQLARGVDEALALLAERPAATPPQLPPARFGDVSA